MDKLRMYPGRADVLGFETYNFTLLNSWGSLFITSYYFSIYFHYKCIIISSLCLGHLYHNPLVWIKSLIWNRSLIVRSSIDCRTHNNKGFPILVVNRNCWCTAPITFTCSCLHDIICTIINDPWCNHDFHFYNILLTESCKYCHLSVLRYWFLSRNHGKTIWRVCAI